MDVEQKARELLAEQVRPLEVGGVINAFDELFVPEPAAVKAIIAALTPPEGWVLVPVNHTDAMNDAGCMALSGSIGGYESGCVSKCYAAMLAARPEVKP